MALDTRSLDDRSFDELLNEALARIPALAPEWTDHNASDPGIALVELLAWLTDMLMYRVGQTPEPVYEAFLTLLNGGQRFPTSHEIAAAFAGSPDEGVVTTLTTRFGIPEEAVSAVMVASGVPADAVNRDLLEATTNKLAADIESLGSMSATGVAGTLEQRTRASVLSLRDRYRAVTAADYEHLAVDGWPLTPVGDALMAILGLSGAAAWSLLNDLSIDPVRPVADLDDETLHRLRGAIGDRTDIHFGIGNIDPVEMIDVFGPDRGATRAHLIPERNLYRADRSEWTTRAPGHVTLVVVPGPFWRDRWAGSLTSGLTAALWKWLDDRRLLGTRHHVVLAQLVPVGVKVRLVASSTAVRSAVRKEAVRRLRGFLDGVSGGSAGDGWPFGRDVYTSEIYSLLAEVPGVDHVAHAELVAGQTDRLVKLPGAPVHALRLEPFELPDPAIEEGDVDVE